jgi:hypothetical protein
MDNAPVKMLTTSHTVVGEEATTASDRCLPSERQYSAPKESVNAVFAGPSGSGTVSEKRVLIPTVVDDYNQNMGGVDRANQLRAVYTSHQPTERNWLSLLWFVVDTAMENSFIIFRVVTISTPFGSSTIRTCAHPCFTGSLSCKHQAVTSRLQPFSSLGPYFGRWRRESGVSCLRTQQSWTSQHLRCHLPRSSTRSTCWAAPTV